MPSSSIPGVSKYKGKRLTSVVVASPSTLSSLNVRSIRGRFECSSKTDTLALLKSDKKYEGDRELDIATTMVETGPWLSRRDYIQLDNGSFENVEEKGLSVSPLQYIRKSSNDPKGITWAESQPTNSNHTDALHDSSGKDKIWLSNGILRPRHDNMRESPELQRLEPKLPLAEQGGGLDARIDECTRQVEVLIAEGIDALAAQTADQEERVFELTSEETSDHDWLYAAATLYRGWTSTQSELIRDIESLLE